MNSLRASAVLRFPLVVAVLLGWIVVSQRCALGQLLKTQEAAAVQHGCCEKSHPRPAKTPTEGGPTAECCRVVSALVPEAVKAPETTDAGQILLPGAWLATALECSAAERCFAPKIGPPPDVPSFVELVLHRSLPAQAPPVPA